MGCWAEEARVPSLFSLQIRVLVTSPLVLGALLDMGGWVLDSGTPHPASVMPRSGISHHHRLRIKHLAARVMEQGHCFGHCCFIGRRGPHDNPVRQGLSLEVGGSDRRKWVLEGTELRRKARLCPCRVLPAMAPLKP